MSAGTASAVRRAPDGRLLPAVRKLLRMRVLIFVNGLRRARGRAKFGMIVLALVLAVLATGLLVASWLVLGFLQSPELERRLATDTAQLVTAVPVLLLTGLFAIVLLTSFGGLLQALYLTGDMDFLLASPVPIRAVFVAKLVQVVVPVAALYSLFGLPVLFGLGLSGGYEPLYYPLVLVAVAVLALAAAGLSSLLVMLVVRVMPPRRAAEIVAFVGAIGAMTLSQAGNLGNALGAQPGKPSASQLSGLLEGASTLWLPLNWVGRGLVELGQGHWLTGLALEGLSLSLALGVFWLAVATAERWYYTGWAGMQVVERRPRRARTARGAGRADAVPRLARRMPRPVWGLVWRDALTLRRDLRNLSQLVTPLILGVVYSLLLFRGEGGASGPGASTPPGGPTDPLSLLTAYSSVGMALFVGWMLLARLATTGLSREGRSYWLVKTAPISAGQILAAKFVVAYVPVFALSLAFNVVIAVVHQMEAAQFVYSVVASALCLGGMAGILLAFGVLGANFTWDDPRRMSGGAMGCVGQVWAMLYVVVAFGLFVGPIVVAAWLHLPTAYAYITGLVLGSAVALGAAYLPLRQVRGRVAFLDEPADGAVASWTPASTLGAGR